MAASGKTRAASIEIDSVFARTLNLQSGETVGLVIHENPELATTIHVEPASVIDWELIELHASFLEANLLSQVRALPNPASSTTHPLAIHLSPTSVVNIAVVSLLPLPSIDTRFVKVSPDAEIIVAPKPRAAEMATDRKNSQRRAFLRPICASVISRDLVTGLHVQVSHDVPSLGSGWVLVTFIGDKPRRIVARLSQSHAVPDQNTAVLSTLLYKSLRVDNLVGGVIRIEAAPPPTTRQITLRSTGSKDSFNCFLRSHAPFAVVDGQYIPKDVGWPGGTANIDADEFVWAEVRDASSIKFKLDQVIYPPEKEAECKVLIGMEEKSRKLTTDLDVGYSCLITGVRGSGKTSLLKHCLDSLRDHHTTYIDCETLKDDVKQHLDAAFVDAAWSSRLAGRSTIALDNIDMLCPAETELQTTDNEQSRLICTLLIATLSQYCHLGSNISVLGSAQAQDEIHLMLRHSFMRIVDLKNPNQMERKILLESMVQHSIDSEIASQTEGFAPGDLQTLVQRTRTEAMIRCNRGKLGSDDFKAALLNFRPLALRGVPLKSSTVDFDAIGGLLHVRRVLLETLQYPTTYAPLFAKCPLRLRSGILLFGFPGCGKTLLASAIGRKCGLNFISIKGPELLNKYIGASEKSVRDVFSRASSARPCILFFDEFDSIAPRRGHDSTGVTDRVVNQLLTELDGAEGLQGVYVLAATSRPDLIDPALLRPGRLDKSLLCDMPNEDDRFDILVKTAGNLPVVRERFREVARRTEAFSGADLQALIANAHLSAVQGIVHNEIDDSKKISQPKPEICRFSLGDEAVDKVSINKTEARKNVRTRRQNRAASEKVTIAWKHMETAMESTRPSVSESERTRLSQIYAEFMGTRRGELRDGTGTKKPGARASLM